MKDLKLMVFYSCLALVNTLTGLTIVGCYSCGKYDAVWVIVFPLFGLGGCLFQMVRLIWREE